MQQAKKQGAFTILLYTKVNIKLISKLKNLSNLSTEAKSVAVRKSY